MPHMRIHGPNFHLEHSLPQQALDAQTSKLTLPDHMPEQKVERCLLLLDVARVGTEIVAQWLPPGQKHLGRRKPKNTKTAPRILFHATAHELGRYCIFADTPRSYNCHWVLWMTHPDCIPYRFRGVWALDKHLYKQRVKA